MPYTPQIGGATLHLTGDYTLPVGGVSLHIGGDEVTETRALTVSGITQTVSALALTVIAPIHLTIIGQTQAISASIEFEVIAPIHFYVSSSTQSNSVVSFVSISPVYYSVDAKTRSTVELLLKHEVLDHPSEQTEIVSIGGIPYYPNKRSHRRIYRDDDDILLLFIK